MVVYFLRAMSRSLVSTAKIERGCVLYCGKEVGKGKWEKKKGRGEGGGVMGVGGISISNVGEHP